MPIIARNYIESLRLLDKAKKYIPCQTQTFSKGWRYLSVGHSPLFAKKGFGSQLWDVDDNCFVDFVLSLGAITLGYAYPAVNKAVSEQLSKGTLFSLPSPLEIELSQKITEVVPCAESVRFLKTGSEACQAAVRIARAYTGRDLVLSSGYHGFHSWYSCNTDRPLGTLACEKEAIIEFQYGNLPQLEKLFDTHKEKVACVFMEPVIVNSPPDGYLQQVKDLCHNNNAVFIMDEVVCGGRWAIGGAEVYFGVAPDLATFGKGISNGFPLSILCGKKEIMDVMEWDSPVFISTTAGGETLSLAACLATIQEMRQLKTVEYCFRIGKYFRKGLSDLGIETRGYDCRPLLVMKDDPVWKTKFLEQLFLRGVMIHIGGLLNFSFSHTKADIDWALNAIEDTLKVIDQVKLLGTLAVPAFKRL